MNIQNLLSKHKKRIIIVIVVLLVTVGAFLIYKYMTKETPPVATGNLVTYDSEEFDYPSSWETRPINQREKDAGVTAKLNRVDPLISLVIRKQEADQSGADLSKISKEVADSLEAQVDDLTVQDKNTVTIEGKKAIQINYTIGKDDKETENNEEIQNRMYIVPLKTHTYYLIYKSETRELNKVNDDIKSINNTYLKDLE